MIWNDISTYYAQKAYPFINSVENTLRTLILKLMLVSVGINWSDKNIPSEVKTKIDTRKSERNIFENLLWEMDFIHLSNILFSNTRFSDMNTFDALIIENQNEETIKLKELTPFISTNNWQRYFSEKTQINPITLQDTWKKLYGLRNKVAHNRDFQKSDFDDVKRFSDELKRDFEKAISEIEKGTIILTLEEQINVKGGIDSTTLVIQELKNSKEWVARQNKEHPNSFIGYKYFVRLCTEKGIEADKVAETLAELEQSGQLEFYHHFRYDHDEYGVYSIKVNDIS